MPTPRSLSPRSIDSGALIAGRYRLERKLGEGGFGVVYLANHEGTNRQVAVKLLDLSSGNPREDLERFRREAKAAALINHPGVVEVFDTGDEQGMPFLVMEYLKGFTVRELAREGALPAAVVSAIVAPVLDALAAAHKVGVLHRDLKPANVMLVESPHREVKLLDFGVARFGQAARDITRTGAPVGTPAYMSPEQARGEKDLTAATDLYAIGAMLFELLAGRRLFEQDEFVPLMNAVLNTVPPPLTSLNPELPGPLCALVDALVSKDPTHRPGGAAEVRRLLIDAAAPDEGALWAVAFPGVEGPSEVRPPAAVAKGPLGLRPSTWLVVGALPVIIGTVTFLGLHNREEQRLAAQRLEEASNARAILRVPESPRPPIARPAPATAPVEEIAPPTPPPKVCDDATVRSARNAFKDIDLEFAQTLLAPCINAGVVSPIARELETEVRFEMGNKGLLDAATAILNKEELKKNDPSRKLYDQKRLDEAGDFLDRARGTVALRGRWDALDKKLRGFFASQYGRSPAQVAIEQTPMIKHNSRNGPAALINGRADQAAAGVRLEADARRQLKLGDREGAIDAARNCLRASPVPPGCRQILAELDAGTR